MKRKCSCCNTDGHNSRTCPLRTGKEIDGGNGGGGSGGGGDRGPDGGGFTLFGVRLTDGSYIKKSFSMGNLAHYDSSSSAALPDSPDGYHSDDPGRDSASAALPRAQKRKGVPWTEEEHRQFLLGLQKFGKGEWRHISRNFVPSKTPTQVASHAQKFFNRHCNSETRGKRRSSLFDMVLDTVCLGPISLTNTVLCSRLAIHHQFQYNLASPLKQAGTDNAQLVLSPSLVAETNRSVPSLDLSLKPPFSPLPFQLRPPNSAPLENGGAVVSNHQIYKTIPVDPKEPVNVEGLMGMSQLSLGMAGSGSIKHIPLSLRLPRET
ncbi:myb-like transcription factor family protein [Abeliophyllum distichum]|uniref:Myb-like transcription factor family protein n=1 Tax=Abeliophyllum distichum TaxID=126358 RepID=A0ABD1RXZ7_9LAMI